MNKNYFIIETTNIIDDYDNYNQAYNQRYLIKANSAEQAEQIGTDLFKQEFKNYNNVKYSVYSIFEKGMTKREAYDYIYTEYGDCFDSDEEIFYFDKVIE